MNFSFAPVAFRRGRVALLALGLLLALSAPAAAGPVSWQASGGWYTEGEDFFLGAGAEIGAASFKVVPNFEWLFVDYGSLYTLNLDGTLSILPLGVASIYGGAGLAWQIFDPEIGDSNTETAFNVIAGAGFNAIKLKPFAQLKYVVVDGDDPLVVSGGIHF